MTQSKTILISTLAASLLVLAGCTTVQTATNTNTVSNANATVNTNTVTNTNVANQNTNTEVVTNVNEAVSNANINTSSEQASEVDASDWLTYMNEEYGFSFKYPVEWGSVEAQSGLPAGEVSLRFSNRDHVTDQYLNTPTVSVFNVDSISKADSEGGSGSLPQFDYQAIDFTKSDSELSEDLKRPGATSDTVTKIKIGDKDAIQIDEIISDPTGKNELISGQVYTVFIIVPDFTDEGTNLRVTIDGGLTSQLSTFINTIEF